MMYFCILEKDGKAILEAPGLLIIGVGTIEANMVSMRDFPNFSDYQPDSICVSSN